VRLAGCLQQMGKGTVLRQTIRNVAKERDEDGMIGDDSEVRVQSYGNFLCPCSLTRLVLSSRGARGRLDFLTDASEVRSGLTSFTVFEQCN
jgi:hypothetical protein